ncbi:ABC transporter ATP-binding protein [Lutibacter sp. B2]|nr:ABC transporter ATP-binding protein [Lutibacter sp. B2]
MIDIKNITKEYGDFVAVDHLSLKIEKGMCFGLLGPNGAGKTTLIKMLIGLLKPTSGEFLIAGEKMNRNNTKLKNKIGIVPQHINLDKDLSVKENLIFSTKLYKIPRNKTKQLIDDLLAFCELRSFEDRLTKNLSGGMKRKLMIAKALVNDPEVIFLDEPTVGIDLNARRKIWDMLKRMQDLGKTIIITTHYIEEADYLCDKIGLMDQGKIFHCDTSKNLKKQLGTYTIEYFNEHKNTEYKYFTLLEDAKKYAHSLNDNYLLRSLNLEDVFYNFANKKVK